MTELTKRLKKIKRELTSLNNNIQSIEDDEAHGVRSVVDALDGSENANKMTGDALRLAKDGDGGRNNLPSYLSANMQPPARLLRRERRIQRNKAIVMSVFVLLVLFLVIYLFL